MVSNRQMVENDFSPPDRLLVSLRLPFLPSSVRIRMLSVHASCLNLSSPWKPRFDRCM